jgi:hypothetical protein
VQIIADFWGVDIRASDTNKATEQLIHKIFDSRYVQEFIEALPGQANRALQELAINDGAMPWAQFVRRFGEVREMGSGRRDREKPYLDPISPTEVLWYRGLISRAFFDTSSGPHEFAFIPRDLYSLLPFSDDNISKQLGREATRKESLHKLPTNDRILDHACTLLAALRIELPDAEITKLDSQWAEGYSSLLKYPITTQTLKTILSAAGLLDKSGLLQSEPIRIFLEAKRGEALLKLVSTYLHSPELNELHMIPELQTEGVWENDPLQTRWEILKFISCVPADTWWNLNQFIADIHDRFPDFQRPTGDYDSWFIRDKKTGEYLRGFEHWYQVEGALLHFTITGLLYWLGIVDLASPSKQDHPEVFRLTQWSQALLVGNVPTGFPMETETILARSDARLHVPRLTPRVARYQLARFCLWDGEDIDSYIYHLTPASLKRAQKQGLQINHLLAILKRYASTPPPTLVKALERWDERGTEARIEQVYILRLGSPELLKQLRASRAARYLGDPLGPTTIIIRPGAREKVIAALAEMGYIGEIDV